MPTILVADDNSNIQRMVALALEDCGITVVAVGNGEAAVRKLPDLLPDVILADVFMPVRNGYEVCEFVKNDSRLSSIPVILLIGAFDPFDEKEAHRVGANGVLKKPFVPPDPLIAMVTGFVAGAEKRHAPKPAPVEEVRIAQPVPVAVSVAVATAEPEPEAVSDDFIIASADLSLRDAVAEPEEEQVTAPAARQQWDETAADWKRREAMSLEIPSELAATTSAMEETKPEPVSFAAEALPAARAYASLDAELASVDTPSIEQTPAHSSDWTEMLAAPQLELTSAPVDDFVLDEPPGTPAPSAGISSEPPAEMFWAPAAGTPPTPTEVLSEPDPAFVAGAIAIEAQAPPKPQEVGAAVEPVVEQELEPVGEQEFEPVEYDPSPYFSALYLVSPEAAIAHEVRPLEELGEEEETHGAAQILPFPAGEAADPAMLNAIVEKVLERLEPQIRDILAREVVRPLAESMLQREIAKK